MMEYRVTWEIDVDAESPEEAARIAQEIQRDSDSWATVFTVEDHRDFGMDAAQTVVLYGSVS
jgi:hypothetical protein